MSTKASNELSVLGKLPLEWRAVEFGTILDGGTRNGVYKPKEFHGRGAKIVNMGELFAHPRLRDIEMRRVELSKDEVERFSLRRGDLLFARRSLVAEGAGKCSIVLGVNELTTFESSIIRARPKPREADSLFLFYLFNSPFGAHILGSILRQVAVAGITGSDLVRLVVPLPPVREQQSIAQVIGTLDDKIESNRRMNETLEVLACALFKSHFVDFDLGSIQHGWRVGRLKDVLSVIETGGRPKGGVKDIAGGVPSVGAESIVGIGRFDYEKTKFVPREFFDGMSRGHVRNRDVLLYKDGGRPGEFEPHVTMVGDGFPFSEFCINEHVYRLRTEPALPQSFLYFWLSSVSAMEEMRNRGTGVAIPGLNSTAVRELAVLLPPAAVLKKFDEQVSPLIHRIFANCNEARTLAALRDALLPKLLSGQLRIPSDG